MHPIWLKLTVDLSRETPAGVTQLNNVKTTNVLVTINTTNTCTLLKKAWFNKNKTRFIRPQGCSSFNEETWLFLAFLMPIKEKRYTQSSNIKSMDKLKTRKTFA